jgi:hypothetical protein
MLWEVSTAQLLAYSTTIDVKYIAVLKRNIPRKHRVNRDGNEKSVLLALARA